jgi:phosphoribosylformylglycinamidine synthase
MAFASSYGIELNLKRVPSRILSRGDFVLFSESNSRFLVEVSGKAKDDFESLMKNRTYAEIGKVTKTPQLHVHGLNGKLVLDTPISDLRVSWKRALSSGVEP